MSTPGLYHEFMHKRMIYRTSAPIESGQEEGNRTLSNCSSSRADCGYDNGHHSDNVKLTIIDDH